MRNRLLLLITVLSLALTAGSAAAQTTLQLRWELTGDTNAAFTLTNRDTKPLPPSGWAIYFSALHSADSGTVGSGFEIEDVIGDLHRIVPRPGFAGLAPGATIRIPYRTHPLLNRSFVPAGPYMVFDAANDVATPLTDYVAAPFQRSQRVVTPEAQYARDSVIRDIPANELPPVFPTPLQVTRGTGQLRLTAQPQVTAAAGLKNEAAFADDILRSYVGERRILGGAALRLEVGPVQGQSSNEAYELVIDPTSGIRIVGASPAGVFYGLQSLRSLLPPAPIPGLLPLPAIRVVDAPRFGYRGFMLDVARNFQPKRSVLRSIDLLARYKLNVFHMHLTDDEGWRVEIAGLPELTRIGARRGHTLDSKQFLPPAWGSGGQADQSWGSGFFSRADYIEIVRYAAARHIEVIPEIEMPGHARAAVKAMAGNPQYRLTDPADSSRYRSVQGYPDNVMDPALESTYRFIEKVVADLVAMHREAGAPLRNIHMGGDEVPNGVWVGSPAVQALMRSKGLTSVDDLWYLFYGRVADILKTHGLVPSGWEEIAVRKTRLNGRPTQIVNPGFAERGWRAYVWNNVPGWGAEDLAYRLANGGYDVVLSPVTNFYFDLAWNPSPDERGLDWGGFIDLRKPFEFIPFDYYRNARVDRAGNPLNPNVFVGKDRLTDYGRAHILGIQGNLWSETIGGEGRLDYMLVPKLFGLAERAWAADPEWAREPNAARSDSLFRNSWSQLVNVVGKRELPRLDREMLLNYRIPTPGLKVQGGMVYSTLEIPGFTMRYTTDGSDPTTRSPVVNGPIPFRGTVSVAAFNGTGRKGLTARVTAPVP
ncbi:MAG: family 20 glycosylhydrolase [Gemmatimonadota bacterium]